MSIFEKKQQLNKEGVRRMPERVTPLKKEEKKDTSIFGGKPYLTRSELREKLRKAEPFIPGAGEEIIPQRERVKIEKELFAKNYGSYVDKGEFKKAIKKLEKEKFQAKTGTDKLSLDRKIRYLKKLGGE